MIVDNPNAKDYLYKRKMTPSEKANIECSACKFGCLCSNVDYCIKDKIRKAELNGKK